MISDNELMQNTAIQMAFIKELQKEEPAYPYTLLTIFA